MENLEELLRRLDSEPSVPSIVDIERAVTDGRRRARVRAVAGTAAAGLAVMMAVAGTAAVVRTTRPHRTPSPAAAATSAPATRPAAPAEPQQCAVRVLPAPAEYAGIVTMGMDPTGRYQVGRAVGPDNRYHPLLWTDGVLTQLDRQGTDAEVDGIVANASGVVVWTSATMASQTQRIERTWRWENGEVAEVTAAKGYVVKAITAGGDLYAVDEEMFRPSQARLLTVPVNGSPSVRELSGGGVSAVDVGGTAVGVARTYVGGDLVESAAVWLPDGSMRLLPAADGYGPNVLADDVDNGWVVGHTWKGGIPKPSKGSDSGSGSGSGLALPSMVALRWDLTTGARQTYPDVVAAYGVNRYGWFGGQDRSGHPVVVFGDRTLVLPTPNHADLGAGTAATFLSDDGHVVGGQVGLPETVAAVRWTCA
jgi:hypothetical protein